MNYLTHVQLLEIVRNHPMPQEWYDEQEECPFGDDDVEREERTATRIKEQHESTENSAVYRKLHKRLHVSCSLCGWHRGENRRRVPQHRSWKASRSKQHH